MKLIIPNVLDNKRYEGQVITKQDLAVGIFTSRRWLWLMEPNDVIILPDQPSQDIIDYIAEIKQFDPNLLTIVTLKKDPKLVVSESLRDHSLISHLKTIIKQHSSWEIDPFYYTPAVLDLAEHLGIHVQPKWSSLVRQNFCHRVNGKAYFRQLSIAHNIPIPAGEVCASKLQLAMTIKKLLPKTGQLMVKQDFSAGGAGNIGLSKDPNATFTGTTNQITVEDIEKASNDLWSAYTSLANNQLIVEVYYPNRGVFTVEVYIPSNNEEIKVLYDAEMRMDPHWIGGEIPAHRLDPSLVNELISVTLKIGKILQSEGYYGYMCTDCILTNNNQLLLTEINVRQSGFLHLDILGRHLFGDDYTSKVTLLHRKDVEIGSFSKAYQVLKNEGLLFKVNNKKSGVILLTAYDTRAEFLVVAPDSSSAYGLETAFLKRLKSQR